MPSDPMNDAPEERLTDTEQARMEALPRAAVPPARLEDRVVRALTREGLLHHPPGRRHGAPTVRRRWASGGWLAAAAAAGLALFAAGTVTGQRMATRDAVEAMAAALRDDPAHRAAHIQETGSAYVKAVARLAESADAPGASRSGAEAARVALHAAALELARVDPGDMTIQLVLAALAGQPQQGESDGHVRQTIWF